MNPPAARDTRLREGVRDVRAWQRLALAGALFLGGAASGYDAPAAGLASWYGIAHRGRHMADGHLFDERKATAASRTLPMGRVIRVCSLRNERCVLVTVTDRGPYAGHRILDLSRAAMAAIGGLDAGVVPVLVTDAPAPRQ
jgi:rare lipoprotein A